MKPSPAILRASLRTNFGSLFHVYAAMTANKGADKSMRKPSKVVESIPSRYISLAKTPFAANKVAPTTAMSNAPALGDNCGFNGLTLIKNVVLARFYLWIPTGMLTISLQRAYACFMIL